MVRATGSGRTDVGSVRDHNEDSFLVDNDLQLYIVADGMGGHDGGEIASAAAVKCLHERMVDADPRTPIEQVVGEAVHEACRRVYELAQTPQGKRGMGSTVTMLVVHGGYGILGHAGDSRLYRTRDRQIDQISTDHTLVQRMVDAGKIKPEDAESHPKAHVLVNAVGVMETCEVDVQMFEAHAGDRFLLCSDGLSKYVDQPDTLAYFLAIEDSAIAADELIKWILEGEADDNVTVLVVDIVEGQVSSAKVDLESVSHFEKYTFESGDVLIEPGVQTDIWVVIAEGTANVWRWGVPLRTLEAGDSTGAAAFLVPRPSRAELRASSDGAFYGIHNSALVDLSHNDRAAVLEVLARHLADVARFAGIVDV